MLSLFPELLFLAPFSAFVIRIVAGGTLGYIASKHLFVPVILTRLFGFIEGITAVLLIAGGYTQAAAIAAAVCVLIALSAPPYRTLPRSALALLLVMYLSLIVTGAGPFAFDLPL